MSANMPRLQEAMSAFRLDAVIASSAENTAYLSGFQGQRPYCFREFTIETAVIVTRGEAYAPCLILPANDAGILCRHPVEVEEIRTYGNIWTRVEVNRPLTEAEARFQALMTDTEHRAASCADALAQALKKRGLCKGRVGLDAASLSPSTVGKLKDMFPGLEFLEAGPLMRYVRMVKTPEETEALREAGIRNERAVERVLEQVGEGASEAELAGLYMKGIAEQGGIFEYWNTAGGPESSMALMSPGAFRPPCARRLKKGDLYRYDGGSVFYRYHADAGGCVVVGKANEEQLRIFSALSAGMERIFELLRPGALPSVLLREAVARVEQAGLDNFSRSCFFCGHGIGLEARDYPTFTRPVTTDAPFLPGTLDLPLEENMVVSVELPYGELGLGGFQIEYTLLITSTGAEKLYPHSRELRIC
ncbi:Xaa-Pro peptidase family protein [Mailhella massiliensis]|uniref:Xaa-Pro peptidase family protein n=1 Tax=Mailhella massiliensis TaxID=1903261 RepID=A0A921AX95_9BACT|nr:Xaa-Pro peptidase family protein [Mailhella massiliensis]HJD97544.1 Xaa-Pro peptidase family protein [Mailhella massiliensis]